MFFGAERKNEETRKKLCELEAAVKELQKRQMAADAAEEERRRMQMQFANMMSYTGDVQQGGKDSDE